MSILRFTSLALAMCLTGCSSKPGAPAFATSETENLSKIERAYDKAIQKLGRPPAGADEFKPFLKGFGDPDAILRSPRDGQPYVILYGVHIRKPFDMPPPVWAYEKNGAGGKRYVLTSMGVAPMTDEEFAQAKFAKR